MVPNNSQKIAFAEHYVATIKSTFNNLKINVIIHHLSYETLVWKSSKWIRLVDRLLFSPIGYQELKAVLEPFQYEHLKDPN